jgi:hypothetical protein
LRVCFKLSFQRTQSLAANRLHSLYFRHLSQVWEKGNLIKISEIRMHRYIPQVSRTSYARLVEVRMV